MFAGQKQIEGGGALDYINSFDTLEECAEWWAGHGRSRIRTVLGVPVLTEWCNVLDTNEPPSVIVLKSS